MSKNWRFTESDKDAGIRKTAAKLLQRYGQMTGPTEVISREMPYCDDPVHMYRETDPRHTLDRSMAVDFYVPCRKCEKCLEFRKLKWKERCFTELKQAARSWFVTLTFSPVHLAGVLIEARALEIDRSRAIETAAYKHVQRYIKRIRKVTKVPFRYFAVYELGEEKGRSHFHIVIHEQDPAKCIRKRTLEGQWPSFVHARLVDETRLGGAAYYITAYTTKSFACRPRASLRYGKRILD